jgi:hypothetical protein
MPHDPDRAPRGYVPRFAQTFSATLPTRVAALEVADALAERGHALVAVRVVDHFRFQPDSSWYGKPTMRPQEQGMWDVFSVDEGPFPTDDEDWWMAQEARAVKRLARAHGGYAAGGGGGAPQTVRFVFTRVGMVHELDPHTAAARRLATWQGQKARSRPLPPDPRPAEAAPDIESGGPITLPGVDAVDWSGLQHAYGAADDVPELLRALAANDDAWPEAMGELMGSVLHQETCYSSTPVMLSFLVRLALADELPAERRTELCLTLFWAATIEATAMVFFEGPASTPEPADGPQRQTRAAVVTEIRRLLARWPGATGQERQSLLVLAALDPGAAVHLRDELAAFREAAGEDRPAVRLAASMILDGDEAALHVLDETAGWHAELGEIQDSRASARFRLLTALRVLIEDGD